MDGAARDSYAGSFSITFGYRHDRPYIATARHEVRVVSRPLSASLGAYPRFLSTQLSTRPHRSLTPGAEFRFVNIALWQSPQALQAAASQPGWQSRGCSQRSGSRCPHLPHSHVQAR